MKQQYLDYKSPGFNQLLETITVNSIFIQYHHSHIRSDNKTTLLIIENQILSDCGKFRFKLSDITYSYMKNNPHSKILQLHLKDRSTISLELDSNLNEPIQFIIKAIEKDISQPPESMDHSPLCECCKQYEERINKAPITHPISKIMIQCYAKDLPIKVELGFGSTTYCHEGLISDLHFNNGCMELDNYAKTTLNLSRVHSLLLSQEIIENTSYTSIKAHNSYGEKIYSLSAHYAESYKQWQQILEDICVS